MILFELHYTFENTPENEMYLFLGQNTLTQYAF